MIEPGAIRLPRRVEDDPGAAHLTRALAARGEPLWSGADLHVARAEVAAPLEAALKRAFSSGHVVRGLENAERVLAAEERGLSRVDRKTGVERGGRISRLLALADDGSERLYRTVESLLRRHAPRVLGLRLSVDEHVLGEMLYGPGQKVRLLLLEHKDTVSAVLLALAEQWTEEDGPRDALVHPGSGS